jgi:hypothetical protein
MSIYLTSKQDVLAYLSVAAGVTVAAADVTLGVPRATTSGEQTTYNANTRITVEFTPSSTVGTGKRVVWYNRIDLSEFTFVNKKGNKAVDGTNTAGMLPFLKKISGIPFGADDLVDHTATANSDGTITFQMEAKSDSYGWIGNVTIDFSDSILINNAFVDNTLPGF